MANFQYQAFLEQLGLGNVNMGTADFRMRLVMTNTTVDTERTVDFLSDFTAIDECDGTGYAEVDLASVSFTRDDGALAIYMDANDAVFASLGAGTRQNQAALVYVFVTNDTDSFPAGYVDDGGFPFDGTGGTHTVQWSANGILRIEA